MPIINNDDSAVGSLISFYDTIYYPLLACLRGKGLTSPVLLNFSLPYFLRYGLSLVWNSSVRLD